jgi:predicted DCC family thiol-disulfide oxidoreductase YuxK
VSPPLGPLRRRDGIRSTTPLVVLYDRDCAFCTWTARQLWGIDRNRRLEFLALQDAAVSGRLVIERAAAELPLIEALHVVDVEHGTTAAGGRAVLAILDELPGGRWFRVWIGVPFIPPLVDAVYRVVANNRHRVGSLLGLDANRCVAPPAGRGAMRRAA